jgi:transposase
MSKALSLDLRERVMAAVDSGLSCRAAAAQFGVSAASAIRWRQRMLKQGDARPGPLGGDRRSGLVEQNAEVILAMLEAKPDITLAELQAGLAERDVAVSSSAIWRFFGRRRITLKKSRPTRTSKAAPIS